MANPAPHHHDDHHGIAHVASVKVLVTTFVALMILTVATVGATRVDFGPSTNLAIAMFIAVIKATLVVLFFMHLFYDKLFHTVVIVAGVCALALFVGFTLMDSNQYQEQIQWNYVVPADPPPAP
jgi:cytochrome c oxidase subunit IV